MCALITLRVVFDELRAYAKFIEMRERKMLRNEKQEQNTTDTR